RGVNRFLNGIDPDIVLGMQSQPRLKWLLVRKHALTELVALLEAEREGDRGEVEGLLRKYASFPSVKGIGEVLPKKALRVDQDLKLWTSLREVSWRGGRLRLAGQAAIQRMSQPGKHSSVKVLAIQKVGSRRPLLIPVPNVH
ncbi:CDP-glycerol:glycerophosphate glycerophosphotransferase, partial [Streptomyces sp. SID11233]|nr:CDP-glycerol:glycerophosphate glycerophosphotransferase [Streptomyces sp. SID11233]